MAKVYSKLAVAAFAAVFTVFLSVAGSYADKVKDTEGYDVRLSSSSIELMFPDG